MLFLWFSPSIAIFETKTEKVLLLIIAPKKIYINNFFFFEKSLNKTCFNHLSLHFFNWDYISRDEKRFWVSKMSCSKTRPRRPIPRRRSIGRSLTVWIIGCSEKKTRIIEKNHLFFHFYVISHVFFCSHNFTC